MKDVLVEILVESNKGKFSIMSKILLGALALAVIAGLGAAARADAASSSTTNEALLGELCLFNPFTLQTLQSTSISVLDSESGTEGDFGPVVLLGTTSRPPIRIPYRPSLRSPFRPPL